MSGSLRELGAHADLSISGHRAVEPYLPQLVFPSVPSKIDLPKELLSEGDAEKEATPALDDEAVEEEPGHAEARETLKVWLGSIAKDEEQQKVELGRFETRRLGELSSQPPLLSELTLIFARRRIPRSQARLHPECWWCCARCRLVPTS